MHPFKDSKGRDWSLSINVASNDLVKQAVGISPPAALAAGFEAYAAFLDDKLGETLWVLVHEQALAAKVSELDFKSALDGDAVEAAIAALQEEILLFFPKSRRERLRTALAKINRIGELVQTGALHKIESLDLPAEVEKLLSSLTESSPPKSGAAPASSASTPALSPTASSS